jgi:hypothetical protein
MEQLFPSGGDAIISDCGTYRYLLQRFWNYRLETVCFVMLNPSTADAQVDDPTIRRCIERAKHMGFGSLEVVNLFALRSTDPTALKRHANPIGPENDERIIDSAKVSNMVICAWGEHGKYMDRGAKVKAMLKNNGITPYALKVSKSGQPSHPLYLPYSLEPTELP